MLQTVPRAALDPASDEAVTSAFLDIAHAHCDGPVEIVLAMGFDERGLIQASVAAAGALASNNHAPLCVRRVLGVPRVDRVLLAHNHPDGHALPTSADRDVTRRLAAMCRLGGAVLLEHFALGNDGARPIMASAGALQRPGEQAEALVACQPASPFL